MARTGRRAQKRERNNNVYIFLLVAFIALIIAIGLYSRFTKPLPLDAKTLCPASGPLGHIVLLVDKSDPMTFLQRKDFDVIYEEIIKKRVPKGSLLSIYALGDDFKQTAEPLIELCNPGDGSDISNNTGSPLRVAKVFREKYVQPMLERSVELVTDKPGIASPLFEMLQLVSITGFRRHDVQGERRLIVVSDMLHHTPPQFSMYEGVPEFEDFAATSFGSRAMTDLTGVKVELEILMHSPLLQKSSLTYFWEKYVASAKGKVVAVTPIKG
jgi:hypothetical protein